MGLRFRKSFKLAPGVRMNFGSGGASWTLGPRGASVGIGKRGTYLNTGIPGTGISSRTRLSSGGGGRSTASPFPSGESTMKLTIAIDDTGGILFTDEHGTPVPESVIALAKAQQGDAIRNLIQNKCDEINDQVESLGKIHHDTPAPQDHPKYSAVAFSIAAPRKPTDRVPMFFQKWFKSWVSRIEAGNARRQEVYRSAMQAWMAEKERHEAVEAASKALIARVTAGDVAGMEAYLQQTLNDINWPRETELSFDFLGMGNRIAIDVDLPEIEDMPTKIASVPQRGLRLSVKDMSATAVQKLYMNHVHGVGFRIIGETFAALPAVSEVILSAYSQRISRTTAHLEDEYLYSLRVTRDDWERINFNRVSDLDLVETFARFDLRRQMSKTGVFKVIEPLVA